MGSGNSKVNAVHVVVIGGSFAGCGVAQALEAKGLRVTIIEPRERLFIAFGGVRAAAVDGFEKRLLLPYDRLLKNQASKVVRGRATDVTPATKSVKYQPIGADGADAGAEVTLTYDFLVLATGSDNAAPLKGANTAAGAIASFAALRAAVGAAKNITIVGGGATGVELAGEIKAGHTDKHVTIVQSGKTLVDSAAMGAPLGAKFANKIAGEVTKAGIRVLFGQRVPQPAPGAALPEGVRAVTPNVFAGQQSVTTSAGTQLSTDLIVFTTGPRPATAWLRATGLAPALNEHGYIKVEGGQGVPAPAGAKAGCTYQVAGFPGVFALGDAAASLDAKSAYTLNTSAPLAAANIVALAKAQVAGKPAAGVTLKRGAPGGINGMSVVTVGPKGGAGKLPFGVVGAGLVSSIKGKDYFSGMYAGKMGYKPAEVIAINGKA